jgi:hypothetical protein
MKFNIKLALLGAVGALTLPIAAQAQHWERHPGYIHALSDLRTAAQLLHHRDPNDSKEGKEEYNAMIETGAALATLEKAAVSDGRSMNDAPPPDFEWGDHGTRLRRARELLGSAAREISAEEENPEARGLRERALQHINDASRWVGAAMDAWHP